jgi:hypothetical protein
MVGRGVGCGKMTDGGKKPSFNTSGHNSTYAGVWTKM